MARTFCALFALLLVGRFSPPPRRNPRRPHILTAAGRCLVDRASAWRASAGTLPPGHFLFEPYFFDSIPFAQIDAHGVGSMMFRMPE